MIFLENVIIIKFSYEALIYIYIGIFTWSRQLASKNVIHVKHSIWKIDRFSQRNQFLAFNILGVV